MSATEFEQRRKYWRFFSDDVGKTGCELYAKLASSISGDEALMRLASQVRLGQPQANLLFAAVHFLLLRGAEHPLKRFYPTLNGRALPEEATLWPTFLDFVTAHRDEISPLIAKRVTNTNEVGRSAVLHAGFKEIAKTHRAPFHLVEIGPSAGLNLRWNRYGVRYTRNDATVATVLPDAPLVLDCELKGERDPPFEPVPVVARATGLERDPVDLSNGEDRDWLRALTFPNDVGRFQRLERAIELARSTPADVRKGDALDCLSDALAEVPLETTACVYHTITTYQFSDAMRETLDDVLMTVGVRRPVVRLSLEYNGADYELSKIEYDDGVRSQTSLGISHPHGRWLEWRA